MAWQDLFAGQQPGINEQDRQQLARGGLLAGALQALALNNSREVAPGQALATGLLGGIQSAQQGARQLQDDRYQQQRMEFQQAQMQDQEAQMQRRRQIQDLALKFVGPNGQFDQQGYQQALYGIDPEAAMEIQRNTLSQQLQGLQIQKAQRDVNTAPTRELDVGNNKVTQEQQPDGSWKTIATAGRFAPQQSATSALSQQIALIKAHGGTEDDVKRLLGLTPQASMPSGVIGPAALEGISQGDRATVQAIVDGRYPIPTGRQAQSPEWQRLIQLANQVDPTLDAGTYKSRAQARQQFTSGKLGEQVKALNTLAGHLRTLNDSLDQLDNSDVGFLNKGYNLTASLGNSSRARALGTYSTAAKAVGDEAAKVFAGGQSALGDRQEIAHGLDPSQPNAQLRATLQTYAELVESRLGALQDQAQQGLGFGSKSLQIVTPKAQDTFRKLAGGGNTHATLPAQPTKAGGPANDPAGIR